jgi:hypothetical protein
MKFRDAFFAAVAGIALAASIGAAIAQTVVIPTVQKVDSDDLVQVVKHGMPTAQSKYATASQVNGVSGYVETVPLTAFSLSFGAGQTNYLIKPAGTLATGTFTLAANPGNGQLNCMRSTQTQTAVTIAAGATTQTIATAAALTALTANITYCLIYNTPTSTWDLWSESAG